MQKPITVIREEFTQKMVGLVNESGLPFFIMEPIIKDLLSSIQDGAKWEAEKNRAEYEKSLKEDAAPPETEG